MTNITGPWVAVCLLIVVGGALGFGWLGADEFGPKDFFGHLFNGLAVLYAAIHAVNRTKGGQ